MAGSSKKKRFSISLRMMLLLVLGVGLFLGWHVNRAHDQKRAVAAIRKHNGFFQYNWQFDEGEAKQGLPSGPTWLRKTLGGEYFQDITCVDLGRNFDYELRRFKTGDADDDLLACLHGQRELKYLSIHKPNSITDDGLFHLRNLGDLRSFIMSDADKITDVGVRHILTNRSLESLWITGSKMTPAGFRGLGALKSLRHLTVDCPGLTDADLATIRGLISLETLELGEGKISDRGLEYLRGMKHLKKLEVVKWRVTDHGLESLAQLPSLKDLKFSYNDLCSKQGIAKLKATRPDMDVYSASVIVEFP